MQRRRPRADSDSVPSRKERGEDGGKAKGRDGGFAGPRPGPGASKHAPPDAHPLPRVAPGLSQSPPTTVTTPQHLPRVLLASAAFRLVGRSGPCPGRPGPGRRPAFGGGLVGVGARWRLLSPPAAGFPLPLTPWVAGAALLAQSTPRSGFLLPCIDRAAPGPGQLASGTRRIYLTKPSSGAGLRSPKAHSHWLIPPDNQPCTSVSLAATTRSPSGFVLRLPNTQPSLDPAGDPRDGRPPVPAQGLQALDAPSAS